MLLKEVPDKVKGVEVVKNYYELREKINGGSQAAIFEYGDSLSPIINSGEFCIVSPIDDLNNIKCGDVVFCNVNGHDMIHMVLFKSDANENAPFFCIGSSGLDVYGWTSEVYGVCKGTDVIME